MHKRSTIFALLLLVLVFLASLPSWAVDSPIGSFSVAPSMGTGRAGHTATLLNSGKVLIVGGSTCGSVYASAELYDPVSGM